MKDNGTGNEKENKISHQKSPISEYIDTQSGNNEKIENAILHEIY